MSSQLIQARTAVSIDWTRGFSQVEYARFRGTVLSKPAESELRSRADTAPFGCRAELVASW
jgi:hypothetical protein